MIRSGCLWLALLGGAAPVLAATDLNDLLAQTRSNQAALSDTDRYA